MLGECTGRRWKGSPTCKRRDKATVAISCNHRDSDLSPALPFPLEPQPPVRGQKDAAFQQICIGYVENHPVEDGTLPR